MKAVFSTVPTSIRRGDESTIHLKFEDKGSVTGGFAKIQQPGTITVDLFVKSSVADMIPLGAKFKITVELEQSA